MEKLCEQAIRHDLWIVRDKNRLCGYLVGQLIRTEFGSLVFFIHQLFLTGKAQTKKVRTELDKMINSWARENGAKELVFCTSRKGQAFKRLLENGWGVDQTVLSKKVEIFA